MENYQTNGFMEQIVKRKQQPIDILRKSIIIIGTILSVVLFMGILPALENIVGQFFRAVGLFMVAGVIYLAYVMLSNMKLEYEYILTGTELDVDQIAAQKRRKRLLSVNISSFFEIGSIESKLDCKQFLVIHACVDSNDKDTYYVLLNHPKKGKCMILFTPNDQVLSQLRRYTKQNIWKN